MLVIFSHLVAFSTLFIAALWDLETTDVPDLAGIVGVVGGIVLHALHAYYTGSLDPITWSVGIGAVFSIYGWGMYFLGMWGGADAFAMSVLGFAAPYSVSGTGLIHATNLFVNIMMIGLVYSVLFAFYQGLKSGGLVRKTLGRIRAQEKRISLEILLAGLLSGIGFYVNLDGFLYFGAALFFIFFYRFLQVLEEDAMSSSTEISELEPGDVIDSAVLPGEEVREKNMLGNAVSKFRKFLPFDSGVMRDIEDRTGYPEVVGVTGEEIERLEDAGIDTVEVKSGLRFVPVFPLALLVTDVWGGGITFLLSML